jgi:cytochrome P450
MWPPIYGIMPRISDNDAVISGVSIPEETNVAWSARACLQIQGVFSADVEVYNPDRWLLAGAEQVQLTANTVDLCFG